MFLFGRFHSYEMLLRIALGCSVLGIIVVSTIRMRERVLEIDKQPLSLDRFLMLKGWAPFLVVFTLAFAYSVVTTYVAIYGREMMGITAERVCSLRSLL